MNVYAFPSQSILMNSVLVGMVTKRRGGTSRESFTWVMVNSCSVITMALDKPLSEVLNDHRSSITACNVIMNVLEFELMYNACYFICEIDLFLTKRDTVEGKREKKIKCCLPRSKVEAHKTENKEI